MKYDWSEENRPDKARVRCVATQKRTYRKTALFMPGEQFLCVDEALNQGLIDLNSRLVFVERDVEIVPAIKSHMENYAWRHKPILVKDDLAAVNLPFQLEWSFLDFTGSLEAATVLWLDGHYIANISPGADLIIAVQLYCRNNHFMDDCKDYFNKGDGKDEFYSLSLDYAIPDPAVLLPIAILRRIFRGCELFIKQPIKYRDHVRTMCVYRLWGLNVVESRLQNDEIISIAQKHVDKERNHSRSPNNVDDDIFADIFVSTANLSDSPLAIVNRFFEIQNNKNEQWKYDKMRGLKRSITVRCQKQQELGTNPEYIRRSIKRMITQRGGNASLID